jgi:hypothetical protein
MKKTFAASVLVLSSVPAIFAIQTQSSGTNSPNGSTASSPSSSAANNTVTSPQPSSSQDQKTGSSDQTSPTDKKQEKPKKKEDGIADEAVVPAAFSELVASDVLGQLADGLQGHSERLTLSAFDKEKMNGYVAFEDQIEALFRQYDTFRLHYRIAQVTTEGSKGIVSADFEMEEVPPAGAQPVRKRDQIRFEMERGTKGWRIVDLQPRGFFS